MHEVRNHSVTQPDSVKNRARRGQSAGRRVGGWWRTGAGRPPIDPGSPRPRWGRPRGLKALRNRPRRTAIDFQDNYGCRHRRICISCSILHTYAGARALFVQSQRTFADDDIISLTRLRNSRKSLFIREKHRDSCAVIVVTRWIGFSETSEVAVFRALEDF